MITRTISAIEFDVDEHGANELYFEPEDLESVADGDLYSILEMFYQKGNPLRPVPLSMVWELTSNCNFECPFCYIHNHSRNAEEKQYYRFDNMVEMGLNRLINNGLLICYLTGGECLSHPDFEKIYTYLKTQGVFVVILTNGSLLTEKHLELFDRYRPYRVEISLYGIQSTFSIDNNNATVVLQNLLTLQQHGINVIAKTPVNKCTKSRIEEISKWCAANNIEYMTSTELFDAYDGTSMKKFSLNNSQEQNVNCQAGKFGYKYAFDCRAGKYSFLLGADWNIKPCFAFNGIKEANFSVQDGIWSAYEQMSHYIVNHQGERLMYCKGCYYVESCTECFATQLSLNKHTETCIKRIFMNC